MNTMAQWFDWRRLFSPRKEKIEVTVETNESWEIHLFRKSTTEFCRTCRTKTIFVPSELGARIIQTDNAVIENLLSSGKVHFYESPEKEKLICLSSLNGEFEKQGAKKFRENDEEKKQTRLIFHLCMWS